MVKRNQNVHNMEHILYSLHDVNTHSINTISMHNAEPLHTSLGH